MVPPMLIYLPGKKEKEIKKQQVSAASQKSKAEGKLFNFISTPSFCVMAGLGQMKPSTSSTNVSVDETNTKGVLSDFRTALSLSYCHWR